MSQAEQEKDELDPQDIPFMHYGIINQYNYDETKILMVPIKRWDPLELNYGLNARYPTYSYIYGHYTYISPIRSDRPMENKTGNKPPEPSNAPIDLFGPMWDGKTRFEDGVVYPAHGIIITDGETPLDDPLSDRPKVHPELEGQALTMINKFPSMARIIDPDVMPEMSEELSQLDVNSKIAYGTCLVTIPRTYYTQLQDIPITELQKMMQSSIAAIKCVVENRAEKLGIVSIPINPFFNVGKMAGGSMKRIHCQAYLDFSQDGHGTKMENLLQSFEKMHKTNQCHLCLSSHGSSRRSIMEDENWVVFATGSPIRNYHIRFSPREHLETIEQLTPTQLEGLARILRILFMALDDLGVSPDRNIIWNTRPYGYQNDFHIFGDILPHEFIGGAEMAEDMRVARISPWTVAEDLRKIIQEKYSDL